MIKTFVILNKLHDMKKKTEMVIRGIQKAKKYEKRLFIDR